MNETRKKADTGGGSRVTLRLDVATHDRYRREAEAMGIGLATHLRNRLESDQRIVSILAAMHDTIDGIDQRLDAPPLSSPPTEVGSTSVVGLETLMLLRQLLITSGKKNDLNIVKGELKRQGFAPWMPSREGVSANGKSDADSKRSDVQQQSMVDEVARLKELLVAEQHRSNDLQARLSRFKRMTLWGRLAFAFRGF